MKRVSGLLIALTLLIAQAPAQSKAVFRTRTRAVQLTLIAVDQKGAPALNLTRDDLILLDDGKQQTIQYFQTPAMRATWQAESIEKEETAGIAGRPGVYSNQKAKQARNHTVILLDMYNIPRNSQVNAMKKVEQLLSQLKEGEDVSLFVMGKELMALDHLNTRENRMAALGGNLRPVSTMELDPKALGEAVEISKWGIRVSPPPEMPMMVRASFLYEQDLFTNRRIHDTIQTIEEVTRRLAGLEGPKNLIWVTGGIPFTASNYFGLGMDPANAPVSINLSSSWRTAMQALSKANITVYPVDARGLRDVTPIDTKNSNVDTMYPVNDRKLIDFPVTGHQDSNTDTMRIIADATGGKMFANNNDLTVSMRAAMDESHNAYELAYAPDHEKWNGQFRRITLKCRLPGITLRFRKGYIASREVELTGRQLDLAMARAALSPANTPTIGFQVEKLNHYQGIDGQSLTFKFEVNPRDIQFSPSTDNMQAIVDVMFIPVDRKHKPMGMVKQSANVQMPLNRSLARMEKTARFQQKYQIPLKAVSLRVVLRDRSTGRLGSVEIPLGQATPDPAGRN